jgi:hypothetical protein
VAAKPAGARWTKRQEQRVGRFLVGVLVGVFLGVLVIAPNPLLSAQVRGLWAEARTWLAAVLLTAEEVADRAGQMGEQEEGDPAAR